MTMLEQFRPSKRYESVSEEKAYGATYTPRRLADFVAQRIVETAGAMPGKRLLRIMDPAVGDGELLISLMRQLAKYPKITIEAHGFDTDAKALGVAADRLQQQFPGVVLHFQQKNFLDFVVERSGFGVGGETTINDDFDLVIANPPYVRTQIMGAAQARHLALRFGLSGRVDLYFAFVLGIAKVLKPTGIAGIIVSNRFMTTKSGAPVRRAMLERFNLRQVWDLGDTKLFNAAVLPAVLLVEGKNGHTVETPTFSSIYQTTDRAATSAVDAIHALAAEGVIQLDDGRRVRVRHGFLHTSGTPEGVWRVATDGAEQWLQTVAAHTWGTFGDIGNIRVGVKTCADRVYIRSDWQDMPEETRPELLMPLTTHHSAQRYKAAVPKKPRQILYPHLVTEGRRHPVDLAEYPKSAAYLQEHRSVLEGRKYVMEAGREWFEIWVPQDPKAWRQTKLVFRDIAEKPTFWIDQEGAVVNGDCYWLICKDGAPAELLWLAVAVGNSTFIEKFYDYRFHNKLYAGRRRFITQYVEQFPLPAPNSDLAKSIITKAREIYACLPSESADKLQQEIDAMVWKAFGLVVEERCRQGNPQPEEMKG